MNTPFLQIFTRLQGKSRVRKSARRVALSAMTHGAVLGTILFTMVTQVHAKGDDSGKMTINGKLQSLVSTEFGERKIDGNVSAFFRLDPADVDRGLVKVGGFNVVYNNVEQSLISGRKTREKTVGNVAFVINASEKGQFLEYDPQALTLSGKIFGSVAISQFAELFPHVPDTYNKGSHNDDDKAEHDFDSVSQSASLAIKIHLEKPLDTAMGSEKLATFSAKMAVSVDIDADKQYKLYDYKIKALDLYQFELEIVWWPIWEVAKRLCLQPVRVGSFNVSGGWPPIWSLNLSGDGWAFGLPGAKKEWAKADVVFETRNWKTVYNASYSTLSESEASALRATVDDDDCVEVFFVDQLSPNALWGGGATWGGGTADTKIISSDQNADNGIDLTHLAHELGHAMTLKHPGQGFPTASQPHRIDGSSGTLMCPSGFNNDNPAVNSQWNKDSVQNPLFKFSLKIISAGPDCQNDGDCGACS